MRIKSLALAIAALGSATAFAQSNVTIYGSVDVGYAHMSSSGLKSGNVIDNGLNAPSRLGFKGIEDLGGGMKALFTLEYNIAPDQNYGVGDPASKTQWTGSQSRQTFVGLTGNFGTVVAGRLQTAGFNFACAYNPVAGGAFNNTDRMKATSLLVYGNPGRADNAVAYVAPSFGGLSLAVNHARVTENAAAQPTGNDAYATLLSATYNHGPLQAGGVYSKIATKNTVAGDDVREYGLGASYDLSVAKLFAMYQNKKVDNLNADSKWAVAVTVPVSAAGLVKVSYGRNSIKSTAADDNSSAWSLVYNHALSKRTTLYAGYTHIGNGTAGNVSIKGDDVPLAGNDANLYAVGVSHSF